MNSNNGSNKDGTYLERLTTETLRPIYGALELLKQEIAETMQIPDSPWKILNKPYEQLSDGEIAALMDIYHQDGEVEPCPFCKWVTREELSRARKERRELGTEIPKGYHLMPDGNLMRNSDMDKQQINLTGGY
uniref:Uncharacterized protein n=1 Tax=viral metagenome TaxID=1070528 RepID=A0A6M3KMI5_9ZZZZ